MSERSTVTLTLIRRIALVTVVATGFFVLGTLKQRLDCQEGAEVICAQSKSGAQPPDWNATWIAGTSYRLRTDHCLGVRRRNLA